MLYPSGIKSGVTGLDLQEDQAQGAWRCDGAYQVNRTKIVGRADQ